MSATGANDWHRREERGSILALRFAAWLYRTVGKRIAGLLVFPVVTYFFLTDPAGRRASLDYLRRVYTVTGGVGILAHEPGLRDVFRHYLEFGKTIVDRMGFWLRRRDDFQLKIFGEEHLKKVVEDGRGAIVLGSHLGSFDAMRLTASVRSPIAVRVLTYIENAHRINEVFRQLGEISGSPTSVGVIQIRPGSFAHALEVRKCVEQGEVVAILADRLHPNEDRGRAVKVDFLGGGARIPQGPLLLASALGCPVLLMAGVRVGKCRYEIHVERFADPVEIRRNDRTRGLEYYGQSYASWLERRCVEAPYQWFNFYDFWAGERHE